MVLRWEPRAEDGQALAASVKLVCPRAGRALVLRQADGRWDLPGGHLEAGETTRDALAREVREELGLSLPEIAPMGEWLYLRPHKPPRLIVFYRLAQDAPFDLAHISLSDEHSGAIWAAADDLDGLDMPAGFRDAIRSVLSGRG
ncbi:NUDIX domain-containing protein [Pedomonas sp. V897]|uniref:NUDIX domain-containing protein n=1 Tax=Pedomonas sp. V897 TaxID=3446482 RepID=UPI003EE051B2